MLAFPLTIKQVLVKTRYHNRPSLDRMSSFDDDVLDDEMLSLDEVSDSESEMLSSSSECDSPDTDTNNVVSTEILDDREPDNVARQDALALPEDNMILEDADEQDTNNVLFPLDNGQTFSSWSQVEE